jgi:hypothetical protein
VKRINKKRDRQEKVAHGNEIGNRNVGEFISMDQSDCFFKKQPTGK